MPLGRGCVELARGALAQRQSVGTAGGAPVLINSVDSWQVAMRPGAPLGAAIVGQPQVTCSQHRVRR